MIHLKKAFSVLLRHCSLILLVLLILLSSCKGLFGDDTDQQQEQEQEQDQDQEQEQDQDQEQEQEQEQDIPPGRTTFSVSNVQIFVRGNPDQPQNFSGSFLGFWNPSDNSAILAAGDVFQSYSARLQDGKLSLSVGTPIMTKLAGEMGMPDTLTVTPADTKMFVLLPAFYVESSQQRIWPYPSYTLPGETTTATPMIVYAEKAATISGRQQTNGPGNYQTLIYDCKLGKGWNILVIEKTGPTEGTRTAALDIPSNCVWYYDTRPSD